MGGRPGQKKFKTIILPDKTLLQAYVVDSYDRGVYFKVLYDNIRFEDKAYVDLEKKAVDHFNACHALKFEAIIVVSNWSGERWDNDLRYHRAFRAKGKDDKWIYRNFLPKGAVHPTNHSLDDELEGSAGISHESPPGTLDYVTAYSHEKWMALREIEKQIDLLFARLHAIFDEPEKAEGFLVAIAQNKIKALPVGE